MIIYTMTRMRSRSPMIGVALSRESFRLQLDIVSQLSCFQVKITFGVLSGATCAGFSSRGATTGRLRRVVVVHPVIC